MQHQLSTTGTDEGPQDVPNPIVDETTEIQYNTESILDDSLHTVNLEVNEVENENGAIHTSSNNPDLPLAGIESSCNTEWVQTNDQQLNDIGENAAGIGLHVGQMPFLDTVIPAVMSKILSAVENDLPSLSFEDLVNENGKVYDEDMDIVTSDSEVYDFEEISYEVSDNDEDDIQEHSNCNKEAEVENDPPLYVIDAQSALIPGPITVQEHTCAVAAYAARYNISDAQFKDLLSLLQLHIPENNIGETNIKRLKAKCGFDKNYLKFHLYCEICNKLYSDESEDCLTPGCTSNKSTNSIKYFVTSNLSSQLQEILQRENLWELTRKHIHMHKGRNICDIQGGTAYKELCKEGRFLHNSNNITFSAFTDGVALFKSSAVQLWPVYMLINEIPPAERFHRKNMILWGVWQGRGKPKMNMFLRPLITDLLHLYHNGTDILINSEKINVKAMLVVTTMDLPARAYATNMTQYNGKFSCLYCEEEGTVVQSGAGTCRAFLSKTEPLILRNSESINKDSMIAFRSNERTMGFLGISVLSYLPYYSLHVNVQIDNMHGILLGIMKKLMDKWFDAKFKTKVFYIGNRTVEIDKILTNFKPPYLVHRTPRPIGTTLKHWKASEFRNWLLFYAIPCLTNILPSIYLKHFSMLAEATYILLSSGITMKDLDKADMLLKAFHDNAQLLYGENFMGLNVHNLLHLVHHVKLWGPIWAWSCFPFESFNGDIKKTIHGTGNVCRQIFWSFQAEKRILYEASQTTSASSARGYIEKVFDAGIKSNHSDAFMCKVVIPKFRTAAVLSAEEMIEARTILGISDDMFTKIVKVIRNGYVFYGKENSKVRKQNSYTALLDPRVQHSQESYAFEIDVFLLNEPTMKVLCKGTFLTCNGTLPGVSTSYLHMIKYGKKGMVKVESLLEPLMVMQVKDQLFCACFPNAYEKD